MLASMDQKMFDTSPSSIHCPDQGGYLHEIRPGADHIDDLQHTSSLLSDTGYTDSTALLLRNQRLYQHNLSVNGAMILPGLTKTRLIYDIHQSQSLVLAGILLEKVFNMIILNLIIVIFPPVPFLTAVSKLEMGHLLEAAP